MSHSDPASEAPDSEGPLESAASDPATPDPATPDSATPDPDGSTSDSDQDSLQPPGLGLKTLPERFILVYPIIFILPFPLWLLGLLNSIPGYSETTMATITGWVTGLHMQATQPIVAWMGQWLVGETPSFEFTGSGDGLASYLDVLLDLTVATVITLVWWLRHRARPVSPRVADTCRVLLRYFLAWVMLSYGFSKVFPLQFSSMGPDRLLQPFGDASPMGLLWTFMGASAGYQMFGGAAEVLGGLLLFFRRTTTLGALVIMGVMTNVFALNMFFDVPVKLYSFHYLILAGFLAIPDLRRLYGVFIANVPVGARDLRPFWHASKRWSRILVIAKVVLVVSILASEVSSGVKGMKTWGTWAPQHELRGIYRVETFELSAPDVADIPEGGEEAAEDSGQPAELSEAEPAATNDDSSPSVEPGMPVPDNIRWVRVGMRPPGVATVQRADGLAVRMRMRLDDEASTIAIFDRSLSEPDSDPMTLERLEDGRLRLTGIFEQQSIVVTMRPDEVESLFTSREFNWINEYPFNR